MRKIKGIALLLTICMLCGIFTPGLAEEIVASNVDAPAQASDDSADLQSFIAGPDDAYSDEIDLNELMMTPTEATFVETVVYAEGAPASSGEEFVLNPEGDKLISYNGPGGAVSVPAGVTVIGMSAFENENGAKVTSVTLPDSLLQIEPRAFFGCAALTTIDLSASTSLNLIGESAFEGCAALSGVTLPAYLDKILDRAFYGCASIESMTVPANVTVLGSGMMADCTSLRSFTFENNVTSLPDSFFSGCKNLASVKLPSKLNAILFNAFDGCESLASLELPATVAMLGNYAFSGCVTLASLVLPVGLNSIGSGAFSGCAALSEINLPETKVKKIEDNAFSGCSSLTSLVLPSGVRGKIGNNAFGGCVGLTKMEISEGVTSIGAEAFKGCTGMTSVTLPDGVTSIGTSAFEGCTALTSFNLPGSVTSIGASAFDGCTSLAELTVPAIASLTTVGSYAFRACQSLTAIEFPAGLTEIGTGAFSDCTALKSVNLHTGLTELGAGAFSGCTALQSVKLPNASISTVASDLFNGCASLTNIDCYDDNGEIVTVENTSHEIVKCSKIPASVTSVGASSFKGCVSLAEIVLSNSVTLATLADDAFDDCDYSKLIVGPYDKRIIYDFCDAKGIKYDSTLKYYEVEAITGIPENLSLEIQPTPVTATLSPTFEPSIATSPFGVWSSSDESVVTVNNGVITVVGRTNGEATITCKAFEDEVYAYCKVKIIRVPTGAITLDRTTLSLFPAGPKETSYMLKATSTVPDGYTAVTPSNPNVVWSSSAPAVATVEDGVVTAVAPGTAVITCASEDDPVSATCTVTVNPVVVESVKLSASSKSVYPGETFTLTGEVSPAYATYPSVVWSSSDPTVATVDKGAVKAVAPGTATITYKSEHYDVKATCVVTVNPILVQTITLNATSRVMDIGGTYALTATITPAAPTNPNLVWTSSNPAVATVSGGTVTAVAAGEATITCASADGNAAATCTVAVYAPDDPAKPKDPDDPSEPDKPVDPDDPDKPVDPEEPVNPDDPDKPVDPDDPDKPVDPDDPDKPVDPDDPDKPVDPDDPDKPVDPDDPDKPVDPDDPSKPDDPENPYKPDDPDNPSNPDNPLNPDNPDSPIQPVVPDPDNPDPVVPEPVNPSDPSNPFQPSESDPSTPSYDVNYTTGITLNVADLTLVEGDTAQLYADVQPSNSWDRSVTWSSSNPGVVTVAEGALTAVAEGSAIITGATFDGKTATATVNVVKAVAPKKIAINAAKTVEVGIGEELALSVTMQPENGRSVLTWSSNKASVASVDANGVVKALKKGTATITVKTANKKKAKVKIKVVDPYEPTKIVLNTPKTLVISIGETVEPDYTLSPATAQTQLQWSSSKASVASVDANGVVTGLKKGTSTIAVKTANGKKAKVKVQVVDPNEPLGVALTTPTGETTLHVGQTVEMAAVVSPGSAVTTYTWSSSKPSVLSVDANGVVTALSKGSATITVMTANKKKGKLKIKVVD